MPLPRSCRPWPAPALLIALSAGLAGCIDAPELDRLDTKEIARTPYPALIPLDPVLAGSTGSPAAASEELETGLVGRAAGLQRRADALRQSDVLDPSARQRLLRGIAR